MIDENVNDHLQRLIRYKNELTGISRKSRDEFLNDHLLIAATERLFQLAIESCINVANKILSIEQFDKPVKPPETYADIFRELGTLEIISKSFTEKLITMTKFRNRLVHMYWEVDKEELYKYLTGNLEDFQTFIDFIVNYYNSKNRKF
jgi:uncharacterized protein YutE (UPF0331/DUF86 family)